MNPRLRRLAVVVLLAATVLMLVHWHQDVDGRCEMCRVQQLPSVHTPVQNPIPVPSVREWSPLVVDTALELDAFVTPSRGRSPPAFPFV